MAAPQNTLAILANEPTRIAFGDYSIDATPLTVGELPAILRHAGPILGVLQTVQTAQDAVVLFLDHGDALIEITALAARLPSDQVRALTVDVAAELFFALLEVNADFFVGRMGRAAQTARRAIERIEAGTKVAARSTGPTSSPAS